MRALIFANGDPGDGLMVRRTFEQAGDARIIAADGGARLARYYGYPVHTLIGDMDSIAPPELAALVQQGTQIFRHPPEKDATDLELALKWAAGQPIDWIRIIGGLGGRFDQMMANVYLLALPELQHLDAGLAAGNQVIYLLRPGVHTLAGRAGDTVSLIPVGGAAAGVTTRHLQYPLQEESLFFGPARGVSNVMLADVAGVTLAQGLLLVVHTVGRA
ncbi:MAG: thiamine diphosphokinase [Anaerolineae bacterium]|jgi:thiamine pyrophosphokinase|nr:thiamine diphosphokinase [Anaerolineae bacterium]